MIVSYDPATGRITGAHQISHNEDAYIQRLAEEGIGGIRLGWDGDDFYVKDGIITARPQAEVALDKTEVRASAEDYLTLTGVPHECLVEIVGPTTHEVFGDEGKPIPLAFALPGTYRISVEPFPARPISFQVTVIA